MVSRTFVSVALALLLLSSGCSSISPGPSETPMANSTPEPKQFKSSVTVVGDEFPVNANQTFHRVQTMLGTNESSVVVSVTRVSTLYEPTDTSPDSFFSLFANTTNYPLSSVQGSAEPVTNEVTIRYTPEATEGEIEQVLAHEFVHVLQPNDYEAQLTRNTSQQYSGTTDFSLTYDAVVEGIAVYVADEYTNKYLPDTNQTSTQITTEWKSMTGAQRIETASYRFGSLYVKNYAGSPKNVTTLYTNPPMTTKQVLHGLNSETASTRNLSVQTDLSHTDWGLPIEEDIKGELYTRILLEETLSEQEARRAATGWSADRHYTYYSDSGTGHVWIHQWNDQQNATKFEDALRVSLKQKQKSESTMTFQAVRVSDEATAVIVGPSNFTERLTVEKTDTMVELRMTELDPGTSSKTEE